MITIIAEKPSVAREIAEIIGAKSRADGYIHGNGYFITWAFGHLISLAMPDIYGFKGFQKENLPIVPGEFKLVVKQKKIGKEWKPDEGVLKQLKIIDTLFNKSESIIVATDAGREGELIFRYIYTYLKCNKPFRRLWISSLTEKSIREGLKNLKDGKVYDNLFFAAKARSEADWLVGINSSQALSITAGKGVFSLGRVQTPTLAMICKRYIENKNFISVPFWNIKLTTEKDNINFNVVSSERYENKEKAQNIFNLVSQGNLIVKDVINAERNEEPPLLFDLTALQKEANKKLNFTADQTLTIAQALYEAKLITYPRTGSRYLSDDVFETIPELIKNLMNYNRFSGYIKNLNTLNMRSCNNAKITDHHAIIITENKPISFQDDKQQSIYEMIAGRMLEAIGQKCIKNTTKLELISNDIQFGVSGTIIKTKGWRAVFDEKEETADEQNNLPNLIKNEVLSILKTELIEGKTKPKDLLTESSLLSLMESCGKELEIEEEREALKAAGIGTPATRAAIIETLFSREYIIRQKKSLVPTEKGLSVYEVTNDKLISDVAMTGKWENVLSKIERGELDVKLFEDNIVEYTKNITTQLLSTNIEVQETDLFVCPKCKEETFKFYPKVAKCIKCDCVIFKVIAGKNITDSQIKKLITSGKTSLINGFINKTGKPFNAFLKFDENYKVNFEFKKK